MVEPEKSWGGDQTHQDYSCGPSIHLHFIELAETEIFKSINKTKTICMLVLVLLIDVLHVCLTQALDKQVHTKQIT